MWNSGPHCMRVYWCFNKPGFCSAQNWKFGLSHEDINKANFVLNLWGNKVLRGCGLLQKKFVCIFIGGSRGRRWRAPPQQDQFLSFSHTFSPKSVRIGGWRPPQREILDPPLIFIKSFYFQSMHTISFWPSLRQWLKFVYKLMWERRGTRNNENIMLRWYVLDRFKSGLLYLIHLK